MANWQEDEGPSVHYRSKFDTEPCPAPTVVAGPFRLAGSRDEAATVKELDKLYGVADFTGKGEHGEPVRVSANGRAAFAFPGGAAEIRKPTREELILSAQQWATAVRDELDDYGALDGSGVLSPRGGAAVKSKLDRLDAVLAELAAL